MKEDPQLTYSLKYPQLFTQNLETFVQWMNKVSTLFSTNVCPLPLFPFTFPTIYNTTSVTMVISCRLGCTETENNLIYKLFVKKQINKNIRQKKLNALHLWRSCTYFRVYRRQSNLVYNFLKCPNSGSHEKLHIWPEKITGVS